MYSITIVLYIDDGAAGNQYVYNSMRHTEKTDWAVKKKNRSIQLLNESRTDCVCCGRVYFIFVQMAFRKIQLDYRTRRTV